MAGRLTTHVLDLTHGRPAAGIRIELWRLAPDGERHLLRQVLTNGDGRTDRPLLEEAEMASGQYEMLFDVASYFRAQGIRLPEPAFLESVPIRFGVADPMAHYHVPLLASPWGYHTYRGS